MKNRTLIIPLLSIAAFAAGCGKEPTTSQQIEKVKAETKRAAQDMKDYTFTQKSEFTQKMEGQLAGINKDLEQLAAKIEKSSDAVKAEAKPKLQALREQTVKLNKQLDEVKNATESSWNEVKARFKKAAGEVQDGFKNARQWAADKIAP